MTRAARGLGWLAAGLAGGALLDTLRAAAAGWRPNGAIETLGLAALLAGAAALAATGIWPRARRAAAHRAPELLLLVAAAGLGLAALEWAAARVEPGLRPAPPFHTRGALREETFHADPGALPGLHGTSRYTTLASGVRAAREAAPGEPRALCIGGSTTECVYLDDRETWPALLGEATGWWVGNVGISGFDTRDHLRFVRDSPLLAEVRVLVIQAGINDLWRAVAGEEEATRWDRFEPGAAETAPPAPRPAPLWARSRLVQLWHTLRSTPPAPARREGIGGLEYRIRRERRAAAVLTGALPPLDTALAGYRERLRALVAACHARGVTPVLSTQAVLWDAGLPPEAAARCWFGWLPDGRYLELGALREAMEAYNAATIAVARETGTACVDLADLHGVPAYFYDDCHFTPAGAREVARRMAGALAQAR